MRCDVAYVGSCECVELRFYVYSFAWYIVLPICTLNWFFLSTSSSSFFSFSSVDCRRRRRCCTLYTYCYRSRRRCHSSDTQMSITYAHCAQRYLLLLLCTLCAPKMTSNSSENRRQWQQHEKKKMSSNLTKERKTYLHRISSVCVYDENRCWRCCCYSINSFSTISCVRENHLEDSHFTHAPP